MQLLIDTYKTTGTIHHAYIIEGERELVREKLLEFLDKQLKHPTQANPDFSHQIFESFGVDDARMLRERQSLRPAVHERKIFLIEIFSMTHEAQNALLKIFEEPTANTHFFIIAPSTDVFLPTLRSRVVIIKNRSEEDKNTLAKEFLKLSPAERMKMLEPIIEEKDKARAASLVDSIIRELHSTSGQPAILQQLLSIRGYLNDRSASLKLLLEQVALIV